MKYVYLLFLLTLTFAAASIARAQFNQLTPSVSVTLTPENPGPNDTVTAEVSSYATDLNRASINWVLNGTSKSSGRGKRTFTFTMGNAGTVSNLSVTVQTAEGDTINKSFSLKASSVDLIWQAQTYTPPFYKGKALFSHESIITFIAVPHMLSGGREISPQNLIYKWTKNGTVLGDFSGYGKNTYSMLASVISRPVDMQVEVSSGDTGDVTVGETVVTPIEPHVVLYEKDPLYGIQFQKTLKNDVTLTQKEIQIVGIPFYFSGFSLSNPDLTYSWNINGSEIDSDTTQNTRNFRPADGGSGTSLISLSIQNIQKTLQFADTAFRIHFDTTVTKPNPSL